LIDSTSKLFLPITNNSDIGKERSISLPLKGRRVTLSHYILSKIPLNHFIERIEIIHHNVEKSIESYSIVKIEKTEPEF
jgi:hypothetical protein